MYLWCEDVFCSNATHSPHTRTRTEVIIFFLLKRKLKALAVFSFVLLFVYGKDLCNSLPIVIIRVIKTNLMQNVSSIYFVYEPLHVSGIFVAHHQEVYCVYIQQLKAQHAPVVVYIHSTPPADGLQICPKHVEVHRRNKLRINSASSWFVLHRCIEMYGQQNIKLL